MFPDLGTNIYLPAMCVDHAVSTRSPCHRAMYDGASLWLPCPATKWAVTLSACRAEPVLSQQPGMQCIVSLQNLCQLAEPLLFGRIIRHGLIAGSFRIRILKTTYKRSDRLTTAVNGGA